MRIEQIFISPGHNYFGHNGRKPDEFPLLAQKRIECVTGRGIRGDRFFDYRNNYAGQVTFFSREVFDELQETLHVTDKSPGVLRRNVIVSGVDLDALIGVDFEIQGLRLRGMNNCRPCFWMDVAFASGAEKFLAGRGGLRAQILCDGFLEIGETQVMVYESETAVG